MKQTTVLPRTRSSRILFAVIVSAALFVIGRNLYRRHLNNALIDAVAANNVAATRSLLERGANANGLKPRDAPNLPGQPLLSLAIGNILSFGDTASLRHTASRQNPYQVGDTLAVGDTVPPAKIACLLIEHGADVRKASLQTACRDGCVTLARCLLEHGADASSAGAGNDTPLNAALGYGRFYDYSPDSIAAGAAEQKAQRRRISREMVDLLRRHGARITLSQAAQLGDAALMRELIEAGANVNEQNQYGQTALSVAAQAGDVPLMQLLLAQGAEVNVASYGAPLKSAAANGHLDAVQLLLAHGANVNLSGGADDSPLVAAISNKHADIARMLLARGADANLTNRVDSFHSSALAEAVTNMPAILPELLAHRADVNGTKGQPLETAIRCHRPDLARYLLLHGAKIYAAKIVVPARKSVPSMPGSGFLPGGSMPAFTPSTLRVAVTSGPECFDLLMQAGTDITPDKADILLAAANAGHAILFDRLIALGADVNARGDQGRTPLTEAFIHAPTGIKTLLEHGAKPNVMASGQTPLMLAAQQGNVGLVRLLLAHGADVNFKPPRAHTPLYFARRHQNTVITRILEQAGAKDE